MSADGENPKLISGSDAFGDFAIRVAARPCDVCGRTCRVTIGYRDGATLPVGVQIEKTILGDWGGWVGLDCGDFAKFQRQVAHVVDSREAALRRGTARGRSHLAREVEVLAADGGDRAEKKEILQVLDSLALTTDGAVRALREASSAGAESPDLEPNDGLGP